MIFCRRWYDFDTTEKRGFSKLEFAHFSLNDLVQKFAWCWRAYKQRVYFFRLRMWISSSPIQCIAKVCHESCVPGNGILLRTAKQEWFYNDIRLCCRPINLDYSYGRCWSISLPLGYRAGQSRWTVPASMICLRLMCYTTDQCSSPIHENRCNKLRARITKTHVILNLHEKMYYVARAEFNYIFIATYTIA